MTSSSRVCHPFFHHSHSSFFILCRHAVLGWAGHGGMSKNCFSEVPGVVAQTTNSSGMAEHLNTLSNGGPPFIVNYIASFLLAEPEYIMNIFMHPMLLLNNLSRQIKRY